MLVLIDDDSVEAQPLKLKVNFKSPPPIFNRTDFEVEPLTCRESDAYWSMPLPPIVDADMQIVTIQMLT